MDVLKYAIFSAIIVTAKAGLSYSGSQNLNDYSYQQASSNGNGIKYNAPAFGYGYSGMTSYIPVGSNSNQDLSAYASQSLGYSNNNYIGRGNTNSGQKVENDNNYSGNDYTSDNNYSEGGYSKTSESKQTYSRNLGGSSPATNSIGKYTPGSQEIAGYEANIPRYFSHNGDTVGHNYDNSGQNPSYKYNANENNFQMIKYEDSGNAQQNQVYNSQIENDNGNQETSEYTNFNLAGHDLYHQFQQMQPQIVYTKPNSIPISQHIHVTKHVPFPILKQIHVPVRKPVQVKIPHPILVPVSQPYPIHVPVNQPVAVPMVQELTIPVEKVVPYRVEKKVPYTVEKHVPYRVEKQVTVHVPQPYPVKVPVVKTILHRVKSHGYGHGPGISYGHYHNGWY